MLEGRLEGTTFRISGIHCGNYKLFITGKQNGEGELWNEIVFNVGKEQFFFGMLFN